MGVIGRGYPADNDTMPKDSLPHTESGSAMLRWIASQYRMSNTALSRMFQATPSTVARWMKTGKIAPRYFRKIRASYYFLNNSKDPHPPEPRRKG